MIYRTYKGLSLSALGMGTMRLPVTNGDNKQIDEEKTKEMFAYAIEKGINYFDTAWGYHDGNSELVVGKLLSEYPREKFYLATKFPGYAPSNLERVEEIFEKQLEKCRVSYFDFYLVHNVCEKNIDAYLDPKYGLLEFLRAQKKNGRVRHLGFSVHGTLETMKRFLAVYGKDMEFCQIQLNYLDYYFQNAKGKMEVLREMGIPVWVMEPVRGGKLASLEEVYTAELRALRPEETTPAWAFRFLQSFPEVTVTLSGMSNFEQLKENIETYADDKPVNEAEKKTLLSIGNRMTGLFALPCTYCRYCTTYCPQSLDIPRLIELYNECAFSDGGFIPSMAVSALPDDKKPSACIACHSCEAVCPQEIKIASALADFVKRLG